MTSITIVSLDILTKTSGFLIGNYNFLVVQVLIPVYHYNFVVWIYEWSSRNERKKWEFFSIKGENIFLREKITYWRRVNSQDSTLDTAIIQKVIEVRLLWCIILSYPFKKKILWLQCLSRIHYVFWMNKDKEAKYWRMIFSPKVMLHKNTRTFVTP